MEKKESMWTKDITHHVVGSLAVFGLVVSSLVTTLGVTELSVNAEVAFSQSQMTGQTAAAMLGDNSVSSSQPMMQNASGTPAMLPPAASTTLVFCPQLKRSVSRGSRDATSTGDVTQLQMFLANHYGLAASSTVTGYFGPITQGYLEKFQEEQGISPAPNAGPLTRAAIARICTQQGAIGVGQNMQTGSTTSGMGTPSQSPPPVPTNNQSSTQTQQTKMMTTR